MDSATVRQLHREYMMPSTFHYYPESLVLQRGDGMFLFDAEGQKYLDFFGGILTVSLGHCHPEVIGAVREQLGTLGHTSTLYQNEWIVRLAQKMAEITPGNMQQSFFSNSGSEADEMAVLLAKLHTGRQEIVALRHSYSGRGMYAISAMGHASWRPIAPVMPGISLMPAPYCYRCPFGQTYPSCDIRCADDVKEVLATTTTGQPAAFIAEPILGVGGFITPPKEYFQKVLEPIRKAGALFICDEVQTGFGRTGTYWNGIEHFGVQPDIMTFAKGIASGMPMAATITSKEIAASFKGLTISTYGGNPISSVAALATIHVMQREDIPQRAARLGNRLRQGLLALQEKFPIIGDVRGMGLMQGIELVEDRKTKEPSAKRANQMIEVLRRRHFLIGKGGLYGNTLRIAPPMLVTESQIDEALAHLDAGLSEVSV
ncbi:MAG: aspartate aminotransferase family protein [Myxococcales bacterium]|nr:aspartate aminotransferase family protein [Myxococcales bacterium]